jgi:hypothetical protein
MDFGLNSKEIWNYIEAELTAECITSILLGIYILSGIFKRPFSSYV